MNCPFAFALGEKFRTNKARLLWLSTKGCQYQIPIEEEIPRLDMMSDLPISFRLPGDQNTWSCKADVERIYAYDPQEREVYGMVLSFKDFDVEQMEKLSTYLQARQGVPAQS